MKLSHIENKVILWLYYILFNVGSSMNNKFTRLHQRIFHTWVSPPQNRNWSHPRNLSCIPNQRKYTLVCCDVVPTLQTKQLVCQVVSRARTARSVMGSLLELETKVHPKVRNHRDN